MAPLVAHDVPQLLPSINMTQWSPRMKNLTMFIVIFIYTYMTLLLIMFYFKNKRLDRIMEMANETQDVIYGLHGSDDNLLQLLNETPDD